MHPGRIYSRTLLLLALILTACSQTPSDQPLDLQTEGRLDPMGIDRDQPRFSWIMKTERPDAEQGAFQILVATDPSLLKEGSSDLWDSEKIVSKQSHLVKYQGASLGSGKEVFWKVRIWNEDDRVSAWSKVASFSMGLLTQEDWEASWIGLDRAIGIDQPEIENRVLSARYLRKEFKAEKPIKRAMAYIVGMGTYELYLNGARVGDHVLSPALSEYPKRSYYVTYEVTDQLKEGANAVGVILGNGRYFSPRINVPTPTLTYGFPKLLLQMEIEYEDGSRSMVVSDNSWKLTTEGPIRENNEYDGEYYDARMELRGWSEPGFDETGWETADIVEPSSPEISSQMIEPMRITETLKPVALSNPEPGVFIFDMGQNMVGWTKLSVNAPEGTVIKQRFAETLKEDGTLYLANIRGARVTDTYVANGEGLESWEPRFVFHGFRYVELSGYPGEPDLSSLEGKVIHDDLASTGSFECSNPLINQIYKNALWGLRGNYRSIPTDCPQRDERQGWLGDRAAGSRGESYIFDVSKLYKKWLVDIFDGQKESGSVSDVCPAYWPFYGDNVTWAGTHIQLVKMLYDQYGDQDVISDSYTSMKKWVDYMIENYMKADLMPRDIYGDWCVPPIDPKVIHTRDPERLTDGVYLGTSYFYHNLTLMHEYALLLGKSRDADYFNDLSVRMKKAFNEEFFDPQTQKYSNNSATANILALAFGLVPREYEQVVFDKLVEKIEVEHHSHITTGLIGQQYFNRILTKYGRGDLAFTVNTQKDYPGYGYMIDNGATTIWELWNGNTADPAMNSGNHVMLLGDFLIWLYEELAGIKPDPSHPGFRRIVMKPALIPGLDHVKATHRSPYGLIKSEWTLSGDLFEWHISIPPNTRARIFLPGNKEALEIGSGDHHFTNQVACSSPENKPHDTLMDEEDGSYRDLYSDTWVATDALGRNMPSSQEVGPPKTDKRRVTGIFYITWHTQDKHKPGESYMADVTKILNADPEARLDANHKLWYTNSYHWGEPEMGYFLSQDEYVIRKDLSMLADAGVDVMIMDVTNAVRYWDEWEVTFSVMRQMKAEGNKVPEFCFWAFNGPVITVVQDLFEKIYKEEKYKDLWFYWDEKPLLLYNGRPDFDANRGGIKHRNPNYDPEAKTNPSHPHYQDPDYAEEFYKDYTSEVRDFFTLRTMWWGYHEWGGERFVGTEDNWSFGYSLADPKVKALSPEELLSTHQGIKEQGAVTAAQHPVTMTDENMGVGKSWSRKNGQPALNEYDLPAPTYVPWLGETVENPEGYGIYFQERWDEAIAGDPEFLYINDWNEWTAGKYNPDGKGGISFAPGKHTMPWLGRDNPFIFVDQYNSEFNRCIHPMKDGYTDNYYMQMAQNIRLYKGARPIPVNQGLVKVKLDGSFDEWEQLSTEYRDTRGDVFHRDHPGYGDLHYTDTSGRNDLVTSKVAVDRKQISFYIETDQDLSSWQLDNWMLLLIDADQDPATGWYGYDFLINGEVIDQKHTTLKEFDKESGKWMLRETLNFRTAGNQMEISIPRTTLGLSGNKIQFDFKWSDNPGGLEDPISFCTGGDTAPNRRFNYRYIWTR